MTGKKFYRFMLVISALLFIGFAIRLTVDYIKYDEVLTSFPFYAFVIERAVEFLLPSLVALTVGIIVRHRSKNANCRDE